MENSELPGNILCVLCRRHNVTFSFAHVFLACNYHTVEKEFSYFLKNKKKRNQNKKNENERCKTPTKYYPKYDTNINYFIIPHHESKECQ